MAAHERAKNAANVLLVTHVSTEGVCAPIIDARARAFVTTVAAFLDDFVTSMKNNKAKLVGPLRNSTVSDLPNAGGDLLAHDFSSKYSSDLAKNMALSFGWVSGIPCTNAVLDCGIDSDHNTCEMRRCGDAARPGVRDGSTLPPRRREALLPTDDLRPEQSKNLALRFGKRQAHRVATGVALPDAMALMTHAHETA